MTELGNPALISRDHALSLLTRYQAQPGKEQQDQEFIIDFVNRVDAFTSRYTWEGHLTASAWITDESATQAVLLHHRKLGIWVQPGGHIENSDASLLNASLREATEETGLSNLVLARDGIFDLDIHEIPARKQEPAHLHLDIRFWFKAQSQKLVITEESNDLAWLTRDDIYSKTDEESVLRMVRKSLD